MKIRPRPMWTSGDCAISTVFLKEALRQAFAALPPQDWEVDEDDENAVPLRADSVHGEFGSRRLEDATPEGRDVAPVAGERIGPEIRPSRAPGPHGLARRRELHGGAPGLG